jgi:diaminopimelate epimerase
MSSSSYVNATATLSYRAHDPQQQLQQTVSFVKYEGLGNDFILIDNRQCAAPSLSPEQCVTLCDRHRGIGADGVIFALSPPSPSASSSSSVIQFDYSMRIYNSDGSEPQMCGNGIRCLAKFLLSLEKGGVHSEVAKEEEVVDVTYAIWTPAGLIQPTVKSKTGLVEVDMGPPTLHPSQTIPTTLAPTNSAGEVVNAKIIALNQAYHCTAVSMGNPHSVRNFFFFFFFFGLF